VTGAGTLASVARHLDLLYRRGPACRCLEASVAVLRALPEAQRDSGLRGALATAITAAVASTGRSPRDRGPADASRGRTRALRSTSAGGERNIVPA
jgi:hypothetical protein